jgi:putative restriction endonuclease
MDENHPPYDLKAPGSAGSGSSPRQPGQTSFPRVDDHLVEAEVTRDEIIGGRRVVAMPAHPPHAKRQTELDYVLRNRVAPGYTAATDLLTRVDEESDFASDTCVYKDEIDPATGARYLEEMAFEIVSEQNEGDVTEKAVRMRRRGVRRLFAIWVKKGQVCEWSPESRSWRPLAPGTQIEDLCFVAPLAVEALIDAAAADQAVVEALLAKGDPTLQKLTDSARSEGEARGEARGMARSILGVLEARGLAVSEAQRQEILRCEDQERLLLWSRRAALASSAAEVIAES